MAISVELGPGMRFAAPRRSRNSCGVSHRRRRTNSSSIIAMWTAGPPNASVPSFRKLSAIAPSVVRPGPLSVVKAQTLPAASRLGVTQISVGLVEPVLAWRIEDVYVDGIFHGLSLVRHVRRNAENFARTNDDFLAVNPELQRAFHDVGELLVHMTVFRHDATLLQQDASQHELVSGDHLPVEQR